MTRRVYQETLRQEKVRCMAGQGFDSPLRDSRPTQGNGKQQARRANIHSRCSYRARLNQNSQNLQPTKQFSRGELPVERDRPEQDSLLCMPGHLSVAPRGACCTPAQNRPVQGWSRSRFNQWTAHERGGVPGFDSRAGHFSRCEASEIYGFMIRRPGRQRAICRISPGT